MKANELRIGNYVNVPTKEQCPFRIDAFEYCSGQFIKVAQEIEINGTQIHPLTWYGGDLEPIPLTEEWLLKFGFIKGNYNWFRLYFNPKKLEDSDCLTYNINSKMLCLESFYDNEKKGSIQLLSLDEKYVHQLQNLYFALTSEELTIKN